MAEYAGIHARTEETWEGQYIYHYPMIFDGFAGPCKVKDAHVTILVPNGESILPDVEWLIAVQDQGETWRFTSKPRRCLPGTRVLTLSPA